MLSTSNCDVWVRDRNFNTIHRVGSDQHDSFYVDSEGTLHYYNLQCGEGCDSQSLLDEDACYEFCPMLYGEIDPEYLEKYEPEIKDE